METLREGKTSLLITPTDHDNPITTAERTHDTAVVVDVRQAPAEKTARATEVVNVTDRFCRTYEHPDIRCKEVTYAVVKRIFDVLFSLTVLIVSSPIMLITAILIPLNSRGS